MTTTRKTILCATDLSSRSERAVRRAIRLAERFGAHLHVIHVIDDGLPEAMALASEAAAREALEQFLASVPHKASVAADVLVGDVRAVVPEEAAQRGADLVVVGHHRPRAFLDMLRETTVEGLIRAMRAPVLLVRDAADHDYGPVLAPVSFSPACAEALHVARSLAPEAEIHAFHALLLPFSGMSGEGPGSATDRALRRETEALRDSWVAKEGLASDLAEVDLAIGALGAVYQAKLDNVHPTLIALGAHSRTKLALYALGDFTARILRDPPTDVLLTRPG